MIKKIIFVIVLLVVSLYALQVLTTRLLLSNINFKTAYITNHAINADILVHGPCEPEWMIDPEIIDSATGLRSYNLALNHSDFADNYLHLYLYLKHQQKKPAYLFLYVTPSSFDKKIANTFNTYRFTPFVNDTVVYNTLKDTDPAYAKYSCLPFMRYAYYSDFIYLKALQGLQYSIQKRQTPELPNGYAPALSNWNKAITHYNRNSEYYSEMQWDTLREKYFHKVLQLAQQNNCKVVLYESPIYIEDLNRFKNRQAFLQKIQAIGNQYKIPFWCYDSLPMALDKNNFFAAYNTTYVGSCLFSRIFANDIRKWISTH